MRKTRQILSILLLAVAVLLPRPLHAASVDPIYAAVQVLGGIVGYHGAKAAVLEMGNSVRAQLSGMRADIEEHGEIKSKENEKIVDGIMEQLIERGDYALRANSLPFLWKVNGSDVFNAACYPTNYITVNEALVKGFRGNRDELAAVLAHEMTHGLLQHSADNYAKAIAQSYGIQLAAAMADRIDWRTLNGLVGYSIAKNVTLPTEYEADRGGFFIASTAGFNPGGGAAAMARMAYYLTYETQNLYEYQDLTIDKEAPNFNDHPDMDKREARLAELMTEWSAGHVTVDGRDVYIDGKLLLAATWDASDYDNSSENAYLIAGGLAKAFHEQESAEGWKFRAEGNGRIRYLDGDPVYEKLKKFIARGKLEAKLEELVTAAYASDVEAKGRKALQKRLKSEREKWEKTRKDALNAKKELVREMRFNADAYSDEGMGEKALFMMERAFAAKNQDNEAENYAIRGRAKAVAGVEGALEDSDKAVELDPENIYNFLNRADVYRMRGERELALADLEHGKEMDPKNPYAYKLEAEIYHEAGDTEKATEEYRKLHELKSAAEIPDEYLKVIDPEAFKKLEEERKKAEEKKKEEEAKKQAGKADKADSADKTGKAE
ncbi:hypothetical protein TAMA11512_03940 [Selenomonas sp. TAMA-11512]|uniref:M48 family metalloprotease n=1 Tax=Selenomonas sp. TAMA-11512 TaxID=3095337 RepID=UPI00308F1BDF|nr:hypothetical protein TAMA11512_03940 [Selenomonas sp. TAMA-11512]